jgi:hypothetical protein
MNADQIVRFLSIFRQIRKKGAFVEHSELFLVEKQAELTSKSIIMTVICFLELGNREALTKIEPTLTDRVSSGKFT